MGKRASGAMEPKAAAKKSMPSKKNEAVGSPKEQPGTPDHSTSAMLSMMKYRADPTKNKSGHGLQEAQEALAVYQALSLAEKKEFLNDFEKSGKGRQKNFAFALGYKRVISETHTEELGLVEDCLHVVGWV